MVVALGPGRFYGSSLPRPRFFTDVKLNAERIDPPPSVTDPLITWANDAHWSMGGLSFNRHRLQGRIEGSIKKLRARQRRTQRAKSTPSPTATRPRMLGQKPQNMSSMGSQSSSDDEEEQPRVEAKEVKGAQNGGGERKKRARRLGEEFDKIASEREDRRGAAVASRTRRRRSVVEDDGEDERESVEVKVGKKGVVDFVGTPKRTSPRLKK